MNVSLRTYQRLVFNISILLIIVSVLLLLEVPGVYICVVLVLVMVTRVYNNFFLNKILLKFVKLDLNSDRREVVNTIKSIYEYQVKSKNWNNRRIRNVQTLSSQQREFAQKAGYLNRIEKLDDLIDINSILIKDIAAFIENKYEILPSELRAGIATKPNFRIIESLCHYQRDWSNNKEIEPILNYFKNSILKIAELDVAVKKDNTIILVPGSGLGRLSHEVALMDYKAVHSIEYSMLMNSFNEYIYHTDKTYTVYPYIHSHSHNISEEYQFRSLTINPVTKPQNLFLHHANFLEFELPRDDYDNIIILTEFFMDTAQNVFEYMNQIKNLIGDKNGYWINLGPLKYGSNPKIEPTLEEFTRLRSYYNFKDIENIDPLEDDLIGYLTDKKSLWQGYYGVARWISKLQN